MKSHIHWISKYFFCKYPILITIFFYLNFSDTKNKLTLRVLFSCNVNHTLVLYSHLSLSLLWCWLATHSVKVNVHSMFSLHYTKAKVKRYDFSDAAVWLWAILYYELMTPPLFKNIHGKLYLERDDIIYKKKDFIFILWFHWKLVDYTSSIVQHSSKVYAFIQWTW